MERKKTADDGWKKKEEIVFSLVLALSPLSPYSVSLSLSLSIKDKNKLSLSLFLSQLRTKTSSLSLSQRGK